VLFSLFFYFILFQLGGKESQCAGRDAAGHLKQVQGKNGICFVKVRYENLVLSMAEETKLTFKNRASYI
jgi:hypothetical protein